MTLEKYKICPVCGEHNSPNLLECRKCETDLTGIKVMDARLEQQEKKAREAADQPGSGNKGPVLVRVCECGAHNPPQARKCRECGEDISDIIPTTVMQEDQAFSYELTAIGDDYTVMLDQPVCVIGRESELKDYLGSKMYVSRQHAKLTIVAGKVLIENLSNTNKTFINNKVISNSEPTSLADGDEIGLGGMEIGGQRQDQAAYFLFHVKS